MLVKSYDVVDNGHLVIQKRGVLCALILTTELFCLQISCAAVFCSKEKSCIYVGSGAIAEGNRPKNKRKFGKSKDGRLKMYVADLFDLSRELCGQYDVIWDKNSFVAINLADHEQYRDLVLSLMKEDGLYILSSLEYDPKVWPGPPHTIPDKVVRDLFGGLCSVELMQETERTGQNISSLPSKSSSNEGTVIPKPSSAGAAIKTSPYIYGRWYKMTFKDK